MLHIPRPANERPDALKRILFGTPLSTREQPPFEMLAVGEELNRVLRGIQNAVLTDPDGGRDASMQARLEWARIVNMQSNYAGVMAKRGALVFASWTVPSVLDYWEESDPVLVRTLKEFALPLVMPSFMRGMAQCPDSLIVMLDVLCDMWGGEEMLAH